MSVLLKADWETGDLTQGIFALFSLGEKNKGAVITTEQARTGKKSVRFDLASTDPIVGGSKRAELYIQKTHKLAPSFRWYAISNFLPKGYVSDARAEGHFQLHQDGSAGSPLVELWLQNDEWFLAQAYNLKGTGKQTQKLTSLGKATKGVWNDWVIHYEPSVSASGLVEVWRNGVLKCAIKGANFNNVIDRNGDLVVESHPYPKFGIYKWPWTGSGPFTIKTRTSFVDTFKVGDGKCTLKDFAI